MATEITLEALLTSAAGFGLTTASPLQRAICRIADGLPLGDLADDPTVRQAIGGVAALPNERPAELYVLSGIRTAKSLTAGALAVRASQSCDLSRLGPGETPRVSVLSLTTDLGTVVFNHIAGNVMAKPHLKALLLEEPKADTLVMRHPSGRPVEIKVVAGSRAGASLVARWSAGVIFDEAPRMLGEEDGVVNFDDARRAVLGRLLPGAQLVAIGSPWAPRGPIYEAVQERWGKPTRHLVIVRAPAQHMNPVWWTPQRIEELKARDDQAYRTDVLAEFSDPETSLFSSAEIERATRGAPLVLPREPGVSYVAAMDPGTRGNAWTLVVAAKRIRPSDGRLVRSVVLAKQWQGSRSDPLSPDAVLAAIASVLKAYGLDTVWSDQWAADALKDIAYRHGLYLAIETTTAAKKVENFESLRTKVSDGDIELPPDPQVRSDLLAVRKRVTQSGIAIDLPRTADGRHADYAAAIALVCAKPVSEPAEACRKPVVGSAEWLAELERNAVARHDAEKHADDDFEAWSTDEWSSEP